jgi:peptide/nickel transport system ATP-binding protein
MAKDKFVDEPLLSIKDLHFGYHPKIALYKKFNLELKKGEIVTILGPSGSGKSTLFELISGNLKPWSGSLTCKAYSQIFQDPYSSFHPTYTLLNQIKDVAPINGYETLCEALQLEPKLLKRRPQQLSGGQLQRASILRALLMEPKVLLADEPTSALDNVIGLEVMQHLVGLLDRVGILLITHDEELASWCSDKIIRLES